MRSPGWIVLALVIGGPAAAAADDRLVVGALHGSVGVGGPLDSPYTEVDGPEEAVLQARGVVSWEPAAVPYPLERGFALDGRVVPELMLGALFVEDGRDEYIGGGVRFEAGFAQTRMGLLQVSARGGFYLAARGGLLANRDRTPIGELAVGEYFWIGAGGRLGFELGVTAVADDRDDAPVIDGTVVARVPWNDGEGTYVTVNAAVTLGFSL
ncbi:MAG TPA: hypothetical protein VM734_32880 [Kofleriaceae bacterium]|nr:hypothetical protein [Kofleriaceae bacterium]